MRGKLLIISALTTCAILHSIGWCVSRLFGGESVFFDFKFTYILVGFGAVLFVGFIAAMCAGVWDFYKNFIKK